MRKKRKSKIATVADAIRQDQLEAVFTDGSSSEDSTEAALFDMIHDSEETMGVFAQLYEAAKDK